MIKKKRSMMMKNPIYSAKFISGDPAWAPVCPVFKKDFVLSNNVKKATLYISSLGIFEAFINGKRVGDDYMAPGWTNYKKRVLFYDYDVTDMLCASNEIKVGVGNGWFASRGGFPHSKDGMYNSFPALILALEIELCNGEKEIVLTDESWSVSKSEVLFSGIYDGEIVDAAKKAGHSIVLWSVDTLDWKNTPPKEIKENVLENVKGGDIILMHDYTSGRNTTCEALELMIPELLASGYEFVTVSELIKQS